MGTAILFQAVCRVLEEAGDREDLLSLLTEVSRRVATSKAQIPTVTSLLTRKIHLTRK